MNHTPTALIFLPWNLGETAARTLASLLESTPGAIPVHLPGGDAVSALREPLSAAQRRRLSVLDRRETDSVASVLNRAAALSPLGDLVIVADAVTLGAGWFQSLRAAAWADDVVAAATVLAGGPGAPPFLQDAPGMGRSGIAADDRRSPLHPRVLFPWPHCAWIRGTALALVGGFDDSFAHPATVLIDFAARALAQGLSCALADDLLLQHLEDGLGAWPASEERALSVRHPWFRRAELERGLIEPGPLRRSAAATRAQDSEISVTVDARALHSGVGGTQTYARGLLLALARHKGAMVRALVGDELPRAARDELAGAGIALVTHPEVLAGRFRSDIVHRPQQVFSAADLRLLRMAGERLVVSHLDLISYRNPAYHESAEAWRAYRRATHLALGVADGVVFFSEHARREAIAEELVEPTRTAIAGIGIEAESAEGSRRPQAIPPDRDFLLVLGADYAHKNRPFAMLLFDELWRRQGFEGLLVLAGARQSHGSSAPDERDLLRSRPELAERIVDLGSVSEPERRWLTAAAQAHICASNYEGFGLVPLEARAAGRPCIYAACTSLGEIIDPAAATVVPWDPVASAERAAGLLHPGPELDRHLALAGSAVERYTWDRVAGALLDCYRQAIRSPYPSAASSIWHEVERDAVIADMEAARAELQARVAYGQSLIDRRGALLTVAQQRGLMRVATRRWLRGPLLAPFGLLGADERER